MNKHKRDKHMAAHDSGLLPPHGTAECAICTDSDPGDVRGGQVVATWALLVVALFLVAIVVGGSIAIARGWFW